MAVGHEPGGGKLVDDIGWHNEIADTERREEDLAETTGENDALVSIEPLKRRDGSPQIPILAVVIVFEDPRARSSSPLEQSQAAIRGHHGAQGKLMGRRDVDQAWAATATHASIDIQALVVYRDWN